MAELHDLVVAGQQQVAVDRLAQRPGHLGRLHAGDDRQDVVARGLPGHGDDAEEMSRRGRQAADPGQQRLPQGEPQALLAPLLAPLLDGEQLLGEERVAAAALVETGDECAVRRAAEDARQLVVDLARRERDELDALHLARATQLGEQGEERVALVQLVRPIGADQDHATLGEVPYQEPQHVAGRSVRPVQVLQHDDGHRVRRDPLDQSEHLQVEGRLGARMGRLSAAPSPSPPASRSGISCWTADRAGPTTRLNVLGAAEP